MKSVQMASALKIVNVIVTVIVEKPVFLEFVHKNVSVQEIVKMDLIVLVEHVEMAV